MCVSGHHWCGQGEWVQYSQTSAVLLCQVSLERGHTHKQRERERKGENENEPERETENEPKRDHFSPKQLS